MKKKDEKSYFDDQWSPMMVHFKNFIQTGDQEQLHLFRVQVKKLRAMLQLFNAASPKKQLLKDFKPVRQIFKHCGRIREAHINIQLGIRYQFTNEEFLLGKLHEIEKTTGEIRSLEKKYSKAIRSAYQNIVHGLKQLSDKTVVSFYKTEIEQISVSMANLQFDDGLHTSRKHIKTLMYNRKIARKALENKELNISDDYLNKLQDMIGEWHDNILALHLFSAPEINSKPVIAKIKKRNTHFKASIAALAKDFEKKAISATNIQLS